MTNKKGLLFVCSGPSGVGKGTLLGPIINELGMVLSISATTRAPRPGETDGVSYHFVSQAEFDKMEAEGGLLESACYNGNCYGTPRECVMTALDEGRDVLLEIEVQGAMQVRERFPEAVLIFVMPPSLEVLKTRLEIRGTESEAEIARRVEIARREIADSAAYDYIIINDRIDNAKKRLLEIIAEAHSNASKTKNMDKVVMDNA